MSPVECAAWVVGTWLAIAIGWAIVRLCTWAWQLHVNADQWIRDAIDEQPRIEDIETLAAVPAAPDNREGINRGDWDDCELILAATNDIEDGLQRLRDALRKEGKQ